jgi:ABC-type sulfate transport system permease component
VAALSTILILPVGIAAALGLARYRGPGKGALETVLSLPLILPPTAVGILLLELLSRRAPLGAWLAARGLETSSLQPKKLSKIESNNSPKQTSRKSNNSPRQTKRN